MEKIALNLLLILGVIWMLLHIVAYCVKLIHGEQKPQKEHPPASDSEQKEDTYMLVGKSRPILSVSFPESPTVSRSEKPVENEPIFAAQNASNKEETTPGQTLNASSSTTGEITDEENEMEVAYTMDEPDEEALHREELLLTDEPMPEVSPTSILSRDLTRLGQWSKNDEALDREDSEEVHDTLCRLQGTDVMEKYTEYLSREEHHHRKLYALIRKTEQAQENALKATAADVAEVQDRHDIKADDKSLTYFL